MNKIRNMRFVPDWTGLPPELLEQIAICLPSFEDFTVFRGVCTTWRAAVIRKNKYQFKVPLMMLKEKDGSDLREFYSLSKRKICARLPFAEAKGKKCMDAGFGWIVTVSCSDGELSLVKPFDSSPKIQLPNHKPYASSIKQAVLLANPSETTDFMLVLLFLHGIAFWRNGDREWTKINQTHLRLMYNVNMVHYKGCIYAVTDLGEIWKWDPHGIDLTNAQNIMELETWSTAIFVDLVPYLVKSTDGRLLVIWLNPGSYNRYSAPERVDVENGTCEEIKSVGKDSIFVGINNTPVAVAAADYPGVLKPNCIYDCWIKEMRIFSVEDGSSISEWFSNESCIPLAWIFPAF